MEGSCRKVLCNGLMWEPPPLTLAGLVGRHLAKLTFGYQMCLRAQLSTCLPALAKHWRRGWAGRLMMQWCDQWSGVAPGTSSVRFPVRITQELAP